MPNRSRLRLVDRLGATSVSFAPPDPVTLGPRGRTPTHGPLEIGSERAVIAAPDRVRAEPRGGVTYPIQAGKIQAPALRDETLARTRLLDWLAVKIHSRVIFVIADAGYGKTTLLADFSRRTRLRTIWYRLDEEDRDWVGFLAHLVAAGREFDPEFAPRTAAILRSLEPGGPTREDAIEAFLDELPAIARDGAALILDDFHLADEVADIRLIAREIVARGPERMSVVFASRRPPSIAVAKLRSLGELAEVGIADLRFSDAEMEQLFRETYGRPLEPDVLSELSARTEGWAASLTLVQAALRERTPAETRSFVRGLSGAHDELHDYLAEEVVGDLPDVQQQFLMRTSILQRVTAELAQVATGLNASEVQSMITEAERLGMLGRRANRRSSEQRYHPLVREFLEDRLRRELGPAGVNELHVTVARWAEPSDWQTAAYHYSNGSRWPDLQRVLEVHLQTIVASGAASTAAEFAQLLPASTRSAAVEVVRSRNASSEGDIVGGRAHAMRASEIDPTNDAVIGNQIAAIFLMGDVREAIDLAEGLADSGTTSLIRAIGRASAMVLRVSVDFDLTTAAAACEELANRCHEDSLYRWEGVSWLNASLMHRDRGAFGQSLACAARAIDCLRLSSSTMELASAIFVKATVLGFDGDLDAGRRLFHETTEAVPLWTRIEFLAELADLEALIGDGGEAARLLAEIGDHENHSAGPIVLLVEAFLDIRAGKSREAAGRLFDIPTGVVRPHSGYESRLLATRALALAVAADPRAADEAGLAVAHAGSQHAGLWREVAALALAAASHRMSAGIAGVPLSLRCAISFAAELVTSELDSLSEEALNTVRAEVERRPERWLGPIRTQASRKTSSARMAAARLLDDVGELRDVATLRAIAREGKQGSPDRLLGKNLARRLAERVVVNDLGRLTIHVGRRSVSGGAVRRKVLALLAFLLTRPQLSATREEVMEAMWPDMDPTSALNSLNQSVYFLRRVFEPEYSEETSAGYVHQDSDVLWLDPELVDSQSAKCSRLLSEWDRTQEPGVVRLLSDEYRGKFALDFSYDDWSVDFREWLHVAYLRAVETQVKRDIDDGNFEEGIALTRQALAIEPRHDELELSLVRLLRGAGAHSAAAEQYGRYATIVRGDLGVEPPALDSL